MKANDNELSHPDKLLFEDANISKQDVAEYFQKIAPHLLPLVHGRPLTLKQYPKGIKQDSFFHKHAPNHFPDFIKRLNVPMKSRHNEKMQMVSADDPADLVYFANQNVIELHMGLAQADDLQAPDQIIFDLDPSDDDFEKVRASALALKDLLDEHDVPSFVKTTGSRGLHIHVPLKPENSFDEVKEVAHNVSKKLNGACPEITTLAQRKDNRGDKVFIDYLRNDYGMTAVVPFSLRGRGKAPVATPLDWSEVKNPDLHAQSYTLKNIFRRLAHKQNPWATFKQRQISLNHIKI